ncbi:MAG: penicillin-binding protein activator LpoB [Myxococcales bacterium]|jgi:TolB-like protein|nr:penicillin-binding protein activator LpoB [Myxococcales bacterium]
MRALALTSTALTLIAALGVGCGPTYTRNEPGGDHAAMSTGLDKEDIRRMLSENLNDLRASPIMNEWRAAKPKPTVAMFPFKNATDEHVEPQLSAVLSEAETWLVTSQAVDVIARDRQNQMIAEVEGQQNPVFNHANVARYGKQMGVKYFVTGNVATNTERDTDARRVQYFFFMQVIEVETGAIKWAHRSYVTKIAK